MSTGRPAPRETAPGASDGAWKWLDILVLVAVIVVLAISAEWIVGALLRQRMASAATRILRGSAPADTVTD